MADISGIAYNTLSWTQEWYVQEEILRAANLTTVRLTKKPTTTLSNVVGPDVELIGQRRQGDVDDGDVRDRHEHRQTKTTPSDLGLRRPGSCRPAWLRS